MAAFKKVFSNRPFVGSLLFVIFLYIFEEYLFGFPQARFFIFGIEFFSPAEAVLGYLSTVASFSVCCWFVYAALKSPPLLQVLYVLLLAISSLIQYSFWGTVHRFMVSADLKIAAATPMETWKGAAVLYFNWQFILPVIGFVLVLLAGSQRQGWRAGLVKFGSVLLLIAALNLS